MFSFLSKNLKIYYQIKAIKPKTFKMFGHKIFTTKAKAKIEAYYKNIPLYSYNTPANIEESVKDYDIIILFDTHLGETHFFLANLFIPFYKKNSDKKLLLVYTKDNIKDLIDSFGVECDILKQDKFFQAKVFCFDHLFLNKNFYFTSSFKEHKKLSHATDSLYKYFEINKSEIKYQKLDITEDLKESAISKAKKAKLNLENFIFIAPEASFFKPIPKSFWKKLIKRLKQKGFDIFMNSKKFEGKKAKLSLQEAISLANLSKGIITLRCGFSEVLTQTDPPLFSIEKYCNPLFSKEEDNCEWNDYFNLLKYPNVDKSKTFNFDLRKFEEDFVIDKIINILCNN